MKTIIRNTIDDFINEELSVNNALERAVNTLCDNILNKFGSIDEHSYNRTGVTLNDGTSSLVSSCVFNEDLHFNGNDFKCLITVFIFWDKETLIEFYEKFNIGSEFDQGNKLFRFNLPSVRQSGINKQFMFNNIYHEVEHSLQYMMIGNHTINQAYKTALELMNWEIPKSVSMEIKNIIETNFPLANLIATLYYFYYPLELDVHINGLYGELVENGLKIKETNYWVERMRVRSMVAELIDNDDNKVIEPIYKLFGFGSSNAFFKYIKMQESYLKKKEMKVMQRAKNKLSLKESITFTSWHSNLPYIK